MSQSKESHRLVDRQAKSPNTPARMKTWHAAHRRPQIQPHGFFASVYFYPSSNCIYIKSLLSISRAALFDSQSMSSLPTRPKQTLLSKRVQKAPRERYDLEDPASVNLQSASLLMGKLPYDVRRMIYHELLSGLRGWLHINIHPNNITTDNPTESRYPRDAKMHVKCQPCLCENPKLRDEGLYEECCNGFWFYGHRVCSHPSYYSTLPTYDLLRRKYVFLERPHFVLNLLLSCRMMYVIGFWSINSY